MKRTSILSIVCIVICGVVFLQLVGTRESSSELSNDASSLKEMSKDPKSLNQIAVDERFASETTLDPVILTDNKAVRVSHMPDLMIDLRVRNFLLSRDLKVGESLTRKLVHLFQETHHIKATYEQGLMEVSGSNDSGLDIFIPAYPEIGSVIRDDFTSRLAELIQPEMPEAWLESLLDYASKDFSEFGDIPRRFIVENIGHRDNGETYRITVLSYGPEYTEGQKPIKTSQHHHTLDEMMGGQFESIYHALVGS